MPVTQIVNRQLGDGSVNDAKVAAGANIASSKLADGANWIKRDGSVAMTGSFNAGSQLITNVQTPSAATDAATKAYVDGLIAGLNTLFDSVSARCQATANVTLTAPGASIDGVTLTTGDYVLLTLQTSAPENGLYVWNGAAATMTRANEMNAAAEFPGKLISVEEGTANKSKMWLCTNSRSMTVGTTNVTFQAVNMVGLTQVIREIPTGSINGSNTTFTLANTPVSGSEIVVLNGLEQRPGAGNDYTITGATITMATAPLTGEVIWVHYQK